MAGAADAARRRAHAHIHTPARVRHTVIRLHGAVQFTPRHTPTHCHRNTHLQVEMPEQHTHQRLFLILTHSPAHRDPQKCLHMGHIQV